MEKVGIAEADFVIRGAIHENGILQRKRTKRVYPIPWGTIGQKFSGVVKVNPFSVNNISAAV